MGRNMLGVVLWSDLNQQKAVIWCEDQGDLAFYTHNENDAAVDLHEGDWVRFDLTLSSDIRVAENPCVVEEAAYSGLADTLASDSVPKVAAINQPVESRSLAISAKAGIAVVNEQPEIPDGTVKTAQIIPFDAARKKNRETISDRVAVR